MHRLRWSVEYNAAADELRLALLRASRSAPYASRDARQIQLEKNIQSLSNCAPETFVELLFSAQDLGVSIDQLVSVPDTLAALLRARCGAGHCPPLRQLLSQETSIESATNPVQWAFAEGDRRDLFSDQDKKPEIEQ